MSICIITFLRFFICLLLLHSCLKRYIFIKLSQNESVVIKHNHSKPSFKSRRQIQCRDGKKTFVITYGYVSLVFELNLKLLCRRISNNSRAFRELSSRIFSMGLCVCAIYFFRVVIFI